MLEVSKKIRNWQRLAWWHLAIRGTPHYTTSTVPQFTSMELAWVFWGSKG